jgi:predicted dehydrogenase
MQVRWGLLGCGDIARKRVARAINDDPHSRLVGACRRDPSRLQAFCSAFGVERAYTRDADLLADPDLDAVYIATPVHLHLPQTLAAAAAGKHVLVEKPMALSVAECDRMIEACQRHGVLLGIAYYRRFYPVVDRIKQAVAAGPDHEAVGRQDGPGRGHPQGARRPGDVRGVQRCWHAAGIRERRQDGETVEAPVNKKADK